MESSMQVSNPKFTAIVGITWGDEGKGRMVDLLSPEGGVVVRYQGGNNAGHTVINEKGSFILNLLPSGILRNGTVNVMGPGMVIDIEHLAGEIGRLREKGIVITPDRLKISDRAAICMPCHVRQDVLEEERLGDNAYGSTRRGIAPVYGDKYMKKVLRMGDLLYPGTLEDKVRSQSQWKSRVLCGTYGEEVDADEMLAWLKKWGEPLVPFICDTGVVLEEAAKDGRPVLFEAQLGALRDIDYGIYPFTSSSSTIAAYAPIGAGVPARRLDETIGVLKAYSTCVGAGPFVVERNDEWADRLREAGHEYGAATGRPRRVGPFDAVAARYGARVQGADAIALTKLDVLSGMDEIPVCVAYDTPDGRLTEFVTGDLLNAATPVIEYLPGWTEDITDVRTWEDLPENARQYVTFIEEQTGVPVRYVSVGPERTQYLER